ncbi:MAG: helix-turn-helix transcriptional regulator [Suipraeoptans sp.]
MNPNFLSNFYAATNIQISIFDDSRKITAHIGFSEKSVFMLNSSLFNLLLGQKRIDQQAIIVNAPECVNLSYGIFQDSAKNTYILGPVAYGVFSKKNKKDFLKANEMSERDISIPHLSLKKFAEYLALFYSGILKTAITSEQILSEITAMENVDKNIVTHYDHLFYRFTREDEELNRTPYEVERLLMKDIRNGNVVEDLASNISVNDWALFETVGTYAKNSLKQLEYMCIISITLISRAAIEGGIPPTESFELSELYYQKVEDCRNDYDYIQLHLAMLQDFNARVKKLNSQKQRYNYVEKCKYVIADNLRTNLSVSDLAKEVGISKSYLAKQFITQEGISVAAFYRKEKLLAASNMLKYSDFNISDIANYFGFSSQSKFGEIFKKEYDITPLNYRNKEKVVDNVDTNNSRAKKDKNKT